MTERKIVAEISMPDLRIAPLNKGLGAFEHPLESKEIARLGWNLLREDLSLPTAVLYQEKLMHNLHWMQQFITAYGVKLAPHGKTTMAPKLFDLQLKGGAWGITLATVPQVSVAYHHGVRRVLMANQLVGKRNMAIISRLLEDEGYDF
jgi:D-serine dehydratase